ncbi:unnamed protein product [Caenorhabditis brenneri]
MFFAVIDWDLSLQMFSNVLGFSISDDGEGPETGDGGAFQFGGEHRIVSRTDKVWRAIFMDEATPSPYLDSLATSGETDNWNLETRPDHILMDHMGFGMGLCCLQVTFQAADVDEARILYDAREDVQEERKFIHQQSAEIPTMMAFDLLIPTNGVNIAFKKNFFG